MSYYVVMKSALLATLHIGIGGNHFVHVFSSISLQCIHVYVFACVPTFACIFTFHKAIEREENENIF